MSCKDSWECAKRETSRCVRVVRNNPNILLKGCASFSLFFGLAICLILFAADNAMVDAKNEVYTGTALELEHFLRTHMDALSNGVQNLASYVSITPNCSDISEGFDVHAQEIFRWDENIVRLAVKPSYVVKFTYPSNYSGLPIGYDALAEEPTLSKLYIQKKQNVIFYSIPEVLNDEFFGMTAQYNLWMPATSYDEDLGCGLQPTDCDDVCYREEKQVKFYGIVNSLNNMTDVHKGEVPIIQNAVANDLALEILVVDTVVGTSVVLFKTNERITNEVGSRPIRRSFSISNLDIVIQLSAINGWVPQWIYPALGLGFFVSVCIGILIVGMLIAKKQHKQLLSSMLPGKVIRHLEKGNHTYSEEYQNVTIFFSDIINFTVISSQLQPLEVVELLHGLYSVFDNVSKKHGVYKVETIGDAFMAVGGCPTREDPQLAAKRMAVFAVNIVDAVAKYQPACMKELGFPLQVRIGLHSGAVVAGVVGNKMPRFCLFGDTVNTASRMESNSEAMRVHISDSTAALLLNNSVNTYGDASGDTHHSPASSPTSDLNRESSSSRWSFSRYQASTIQYINCPNEVLHLECRGEVSIKGKGLMRTYWATSSCAKCGVTVGDGCHGQEVAESSI